LVLRPIAAAAPFCGIKPVSDDGIMLDWSREARIGVAEAVLCASKTAEQIGRIVALAQGRNHSLLLTKLDANRFAELDPAVQERLNFDSLSRTGVLDNGLPISVPAGVGIVCAGTSDLAVGVEAQRALAFHGVQAPLIGDHLEQIAVWRIVIVVAGMEGALFSVAAGQVRGLVIAVPTSVGYGVATGGTTALHSALASCAPGVVTVNIDNGFGAACAALKLLRVFAPSR